MSGPNGLAELAAHTQHLPVSRDTNTSASSGYSRQEACGLHDGASMTRSIKGADTTSDRQSASDVTFARLAGVGTGMDPDLTLIARQRLKARLHLEVLRVLQWCFHMLSIQYQNWPGADLL